MIKRKTNISKKQRLLKSLFNPTVITFIVIFLFSFTTFKFWISWGDKGHPFVNDVDQYYSYLIAQFVYHDFTFHFPNSFWLMPTEINTLVPKVTMGMAFMYLPFFTLADIIAFFFNFDRLGYSEPYAWCIHLGSILYVLIGLWYLNKILEMYFSQWVSSISILLLFFGTNLLYYTFKGSELTHGYLFFLFSVFFYFVIKWYSTNQSKYIFGFSFIAGLITLVRPSEFLVLIIPLFYNATSIKKLTSNIKLLIALHWKLLIVVFLFFLPIIPQLIFWKVYAGKFFFFSYGSNERFFFNDPQFYNVLLGWRKGWFIYTPLMIFAVMGLLLMIKQNRGLFIPITIYLLSNIYLISSWWDWGFGGSFGMRALVQCYAFLAIPLAYFIKTIFNISKKWLLFFVNTAFISFATFFVVNNIYQAWLERNFYFHWDSMTKESYMYTFITKSPSEIDRAHLETLFKSPNYEEMRKGNRDE